MSSVSAVVAWRAGYRSALRISFPEGVRGSADASSTRFGTLKPASDSAQWRRSSSGARVGAVLEDDDRGHRLLPLRVLAADHGGVGDLGVAQQDLLDFGRDDVLAAADDHVVDAVFDVEEALLVDPAQIAGVQPAVGVGTAGSDGRALDEDLAFLDAQVGRQQRPAGGTELAPRVGGGERRHLRAGLGQAIGLDHGGAAADRLLERSSGTGPPPTRIARGPERSAPASSRRVSIVVDQREDGDLVAPPGRRRRGRRRSRRGPSRWSRR